MAGRLDMLKTVYVDMSLISQWIRVSDTATLDLKPVWVTQVQCCGSSIHPILDCSWTLKNIEATHDSNVTFQ